jgi:hypothetical protein
MKRPGKLIPAEGPSSLPPPPPRQRPPGATTPEVDRRGRVGSRPPTSLAENACPSPAVQMARKTSPRTRHAPGLHSSALPWGVPSRSTAVAARAPATAGGLCAPGSATVGPKDRESARRSPTTRVRSRRRRSPVTEILPVARDLPVRLPATCDTREPSGRKAVDRKTSTRLWSGRSPRGVHISMPQCSRHVAAPSVAKPPGPPTSASPPGLRDLYVRATSGESPPSGRRTTLPGQAGQLPGPDSHRLGVSCCGQSPAKETRCFAPGNPVTSRFQRG